MTITAAEVEALSEQVEAQRVAGLAQHQALEQAEARAEALERALRALLGQLSNIEVLGEHEVMDTNRTWRNTTRAKVNAIIEEAYAALASAAGAEGDGR